MTDGLGFLPEGAECSEVSVQRMNHLSQSKTIIHLLCCTQFPTESTGPVTVKPTLQKEIPHKENNPGRILRHDSELPLSQKRAIASSFGVIKSKSLRGDFRSKFNLFNAISGFIVVIKYPATPRSPSPVFGELRGGHHTHHSHVVPWLRRNGDKMSCE